MSNFMTGGLLSIKKRQLSMDGDVSMTCGFPTVDNFEVIIGAGSCLFQAISHCLYGTEDRHTKICSVVVDNVTKHFFVYKDFIIGDQSYGQSIRNYYNR